MKGFPPAAWLAVAVAFLLGFSTHFLYQRWTRPPDKNQAHPVTFSPLLTDAQSGTELPLFDAADISTIRSRAGTQAKIRGRIYRVGHSTKSNTYFLNFGPSRDSFTGVIFASALERFTQKKIHPTSYEGKNVQFTGRIKNHPRFGVEMILEDPSQIKVLQ